MILQTIMQVSRPSMVFRVVSNKAPHLLKPRMFISQAKSNIFTFVWAIENVNMFYRRTIKSPFFIVPSVNRQWYIKLCLQDKDDQGLMSFKLLRKWGNRSFEVENIDYELSILTSGGSSLSKREFYFSRDKSQQKLYVPREVLVQRKTELLPNDTLTMQCKIRSSSTVVNSFARTRLRIEKVSVPFLIRDVCSSDESVKYTEEVRPIFFRNSRIYSKIFCPSCREEKIELKLQSGIYRDEESYDDEIDDDRRDDDKIDDDRRDDKHYDDRRYKDEYDEDKCDDDELDEDERNSDRKKDAIDCYTCKISLIDALGREQGIFDETRFDFNQYHVDDASQERIVLPLTRKMLMENSSKYLTDGALSLKCLFTFYSDPSMREIVFTKYGNSDVHGYSSRCFDEDKNGDATKLRYDLKNLYGDGNLSDFTIQTETKSFSVHKNILISRCPFFRSMITGCVKQDLYLSDVDSETMHRFLLYIYTDKVEEIEWENALKLYAAAEQFKMATLMKKCSTILVEKLTTRNVCDILLLAYKYHDEEMKSSIRDFISVNGEEIFTSDQWLKMEETNSSIAVETVRLNYLKKG